jgi:hypothetical protein
MKKIVYLVSAIIILSLSASAQHAFRANHAINHIGQQVVVVDSIKDINIYNDSTAVIALGGKDTKEFLNVVFNFNSRLKFDPTLLATLKDSLMEVNGFVVLIAGKPAIVVTDNEKLYFFSNHINQNWLVTSQLSYKKN